MVFEWEAKLTDIPEGTLVTRLNRQGRNIKQIIGHLIDSASNHHQRFVRLQYTSYLVFPDFSKENDTWISIQQHQEENWHEMLQLWKFYNLHLAHIIVHIDHSWLKNTWTDGELDPILLEDSIFEYLSHLTLHINEIKALMEMQNGK